MICPLCDYRDHPPGCDECGWCQFPMSAVDTPVPIDRVDHSLMFDPVLILRPKPPVTVPIDATLGTAMRLMIQHHVGAILVIGQQNHLEGILTERDFLTKVATHPSSEYYPISPWMTRNPECVTPNDSLAIALGKMTIGGYRHLPVVENAIPVGVISVRDILRHIMTLCKERRLPMVEE
jgi:CBS domain-containing protein